MAKNKSTLRKRGINTLKQWCLSNGYNGVTKECVMSATQSNDPKLQNMGKQAVLQRVASEQEK